jgi:GNAT superfamily N-acetyltransferase
MPSERPSAAERQRVADVEQLVYSFASQVCQYPATGDPGIGYFQGIIDATCYVDTLLWRDKAGVVRGILNHYPMAIPPYERAGNINVMVDPAYQRQGIATALLKEALRRWAIDLCQQHYTAAGRKLVARVAKGGA